MANALANMWQTLAMRGIIAILFGGIALIWPGLTLLAFVAMFGIYALASGILAGLMAFSKQPTVPRGLLIAEAIVGVGAGLVTFSLPALTTVTLLYIIGIWALLAGVIRAVHAFTVKADAANRWLLGISGGLTALLGVILLAQPAVGALALAWFIGTMAIAYGILEVVLAFKVRNLPEDVREKAAKTWSIRSEEAKERLKK